MIFFTFGSNLSIFRKCAVALSILVCISSCNANSQMTNFIELPVSMSLGIALQVFALNIIMCTISGAIAIKKLRTADPADIFY